MKKNDENRKLGKLVVILLFAALITMSATQAMIKMDHTTNQTWDKSSGMLLSYDYLYTWEDDFDNEQWIDSTKSYDYETADGIVSMKNTYSIWDDSSWTKMKLVTVKNNVGQILDNYAVRLIVDYDSDMQSDYGDIRFKHEDYETIWLDYWIEDKNVNSAIVWVKFPSLPVGQGNMYMFYGNPGTTDQSDFYSVFSDWDEEWANDEKVSTHIYTEGAWDPDVAYGNSRFLVVWEEGQAPGNGILFYKQSIRGSIFDTNGNAINEDFTIRSGQGEQWHHENPSVAYGGGKFFVAWEHYAVSTDASTMRILGKMVTLNGDVGSQILICDESDIQADPNVAFDSINNRFLVVWEDSRQTRNNYNIYGKIYDINGNQIGNEKTICNAANSQSEPWVAFDSVNEQYMIVWEEGESPNNGPFDIWVGMFDSDLNCIGPSSGNQPMKLTNSNSNTDYNFPCVAFSEETRRFLITWNEGDISSGDWDGDVWGKLLDESGNAVGPTMFKIRAGNFVRTDIVPYLSTSFFVSYNGGGNIWGKFISQDGEVYDGDIQLSASSSAVADWANIAVNNNEIFVTWEDTRVDYAPPFNGMPDTYGNIWHLNALGGSEVTCTIGNEKQLILEAQLTSREIDFDNILHWYDFDAVFNGGVTFDILDGNGNTVLISDVSSGVDISSLGSGSICLRAHLTRTDPSDTSTLDRWAVRYVGKDEEPPRTELDFIDGIKEDNEWYTSEGVTIWLHAEDFPEDTGSGIDKTYYTLNYGSTQEYNEASGIHLATSQGSNWMGQWEVNFWSEDKSNNVENRNKPENKLNIKIDAERPYVEITDPTNEQKVNVPFWVRADATDNAEIDRVEFDIEPFGERPGILPYVDDTPPYEWECDVGAKSIIHPISNDPQPAGVNVMVRAQVYDKSGQTWTHEVWVYVENWGRIGGFENRMCFVLAYGTGSVAEAQSDINKKLVNADRIHFSENPEPKSSFFGDINWEYSTGFCVSVGLDGTYNTGGAHSGTANNFLGIADKNIIVGLASYVIVKR